MHSMYVYDVADCTGGTESKCIARQHMDRVGCRLRHHSEIGLVP
jgi:hypothetical protein